jgi:predicted nucleotidyltransferase component of viral defense system
MQLRALSKNLAKENNITAQAVLQNYMLERFLFRLSKSDFRSNFILKGGFLISAILGIQARTTMDIDVQKLWENYQKEYFYAKNIKFNTICRSVLKFLTEITH